MNADFEFPFYNYQMQNPLWQKYEKVINEMSSEQKNYVGKHEKVLQSKQIMISAFIDYLFEQNKNTFAASSDNAKQIINNYIADIEDASKGYISRAEQLEKENQELKEQLKFLIKGDKNAQDTTTTI